VRKDIKKAVEHMDIVLTNLQKVINNDNIPKEVKIKISNIIEGSSVYKEELSRLRELRIT